MSNISEYKNIAAFHPGYYVAEIIEDMGVSQAEFATRLGTTPKTVSKLVNGQINLSLDLAKKLSAMLGSSVDVWLNLQMSYEKKILEIEQEKDIDAQIEIARQIDYSYFVNVAKLPAVKSIREKVENLCKYSEINHINENPSDNRVENLEWCTRKYNINYNGRTKQFMKKVQQLSDDGTVMCVFDSLSEASRISGARQGAISNACIGRAKTAGGYKWAFV